MITKNTVTAIMIIIGVAIINMIPSCVDYIIPNEKEELDDNDAPTT